MRIKLEKKIDLASFGEEWKDCYLLFNAPTYKDLKLFTDVDLENQNDSFEKTMIVLKELYIEGLVKSDKGKEPLKKDDFDALPIEMLIKIIKELTGQPSPN